MAKQTETGEVRGDGAYSYAGLKRTLGWGIAAIRHARQAGLRVHRFGNQPIVLGRDLVEFVKTLETDDQEEVQSDGQAKREDDPQPSGPVAGGSCPA